MLRRIDITNTRYTLEAAEPPKQINVDYTFRQNGFVVNIEALPLLAIKKISYDDRQTL